MDELTHLSQPLRSMSGTDMAMVTHTDESGEARMSTILPTHAAENISHRMQQKLLESEMLKKFNISLERVFTESAVSKALIKLADEKNATVANMEAEITMLRKENANLKKRLEIEQMESVSNELLSNVGVWCCVRGETGTVGCVGECYPAENDKKNERTTSKSID